MWVFAEPKFGGKHHLERRHGSLPSAAEWCSAQLRPPPRPRRRGARAPRCPARARPRRRGGAASCHLQQPGSGSVWWGPPRPRAEGKVKKEIASKSLVLNDEAIKPPAHFTSQIGSLMDYWNELHIQTWAAIQMISSRCRGSEHRDNWRHSDQSELAVGSRDPDWPMRADLLTRIRRWCWARRWWCCRCSSRCPPSPRALSPAGCSSCGCSCLHSTPAPAATLRCPDLTHVKRDSRPLGVVVDDLVVVVPVHVLRGLQRLQCDTRPNYYPCQLITKTWKQDLTMFVKFVQYSEKVQIRSLNAPTTLSNMACMSALTSSMMQTREMSPPAMA